MIDRKDSLGYLYPHLIKEWHRTKNGDLNPFELAPHSKKKIWWTCSEKDYHDWDAVCYSRVGKRAQNCPYCAGKRVHPKDSLGELNKEVAKEWNQEKNGLLTPFDVTPKSNQRAWFICVNGHEKYMKIYQKVNLKTGCQECLSLKFKYPEIFKELHPTKNPNSYLDKITFGSNKKLWWKCSKEECGHEWRATPNNRIGNESGCPACAGTVVTDKNRLSKIYPDLIKEWDCEENELTPDDISYASTTEVHWICSNEDCRYKWKATVANRANGKTECPKCAGKRAMPGYNFAQCCPELLREWNEKLNETDPYSITSRSDLNAWWNCDLGHKPFRQRVADRTDPKKKTGCPKCAKKFKTSFSEMAFYYYLKKVFHYVENGKLMTVENEVYEIDVYIQDINLGLEYDGFHFHKTHDRIHRDIQKNKAFQNLIHLVRIREEGLPRIEPYSSTVIQRLNPKDKFYLLPSLKELRTYLLKSFELTHEQINKLKEWDSISIQDDYISIYDLYKRPISFDQCVLSDELLQKEWAYDLNNIDPRHVRKIENMRVSWRCHKKECRNEWKTSVYHRFKDRSGCVKCSYKLRGEMSKKRAEDKRNQKK